MNIPLLAVAFFMASLTATGPVRASEVAAPPNYGDRVAAFLLRGDSKGRSFVSDALSASALSEVARVWAVKTKADRVFTLVTVAVPGSKGEERLVEALSHWTGPGRITSVDGVIMFLHDAVGRAEQLLNDPRTKREIDAAIMADNQTGVPIPGSKEAMERVRRLREKGAKGVLAVYQNKQVTGDNVKNKGDNCVGPIFWWGLEGRDAALQVCKADKF